MHGLQREELAGQLQTEGGLEYELRMFADTEGRLGAQLLCGKVTTHQYLRKGHQGLHNHL